MNDSWEEAKNRVRAAADIVQVIGEHVQLRRAGGHFTGLCPFHGEKTPSFSVNPQRQLYKCFGCGESGDVFAFLMKKQQQSFPEVLKELARRCHVDLPEPKMSAADRERQRHREQLHQVNQEAAKIFHQYLLAAGSAAPARHYLRRRGVPLEFIEKYQLGYAPAPAVGGWKFIVSRLQAQKIPVEAIEQAGLAVRSERGGWHDRFRDRILFPIVDLSGKIAAFGGRILGDGQPKYMNSPESLIFAKSRILFGLHQHREAIRKSRRAIVVEGNFDLLLLAVQGIGTAVAPLGTALTREHVHALRQHCDEAVLLFDGDAAGFKAARRSIPLFLGEQLEAKVALLPAGYDPDSFVREKGAAAVQELVAAAAPLPEFVFSALAQEHGLTLAGKNRILAELSELVRQTPEPARRALMAAHFAEKLGIAPALLLPEPQRPAQPAAEIRPPLPEPMPAQTEEAAAATPAPLPEQQRYLLEFLVFYPECFEELRKGGLEEYACRCAPPVQATIAAMSRLAAAGPFLPEQLLAALSAGPARQHVADILMQAEKVEQNAFQDEETIRQRCQELLAWLRFSAQHKDIEELHRQLSLTKQSSSEPVPIFLQVLS